MARTASSKPLDFSPSATRPSPPSTTAISERSPRALVDFAVWGRRPLELGRSRAVGGDARTGLRKPVRDRQFGAHKPYFVSNYHTSCFNTNNPLVVYRTNAPACHA